MAEEIIGIRVQVDGGQAEKSVGNIRQQLREANRALVEAQGEFGDYSQEAIAAAQRVAELRDRVQEASETAALFDPGAKFKAFSGSLQAVAGGFAAVQGALGLVGVESEDLQKQLLKVQSALALSEGLSRISDSAKDFQRLGAVIQQTTVFQKGLAAANLATAAAQKALGVATVTTSTGFKVLRGAIIATGIGALAIAVIAVVQNFDKLKAALLNAVPGLKTIADGIANIVQGVTDFLGITSEAERQTAAALEANAKAIRATERELELNADKYDEFTQRKIKANLEYRKSFEELTKDEKLTEDERNRYIAQARAKANREIAQADVDRQAKADKAAEDGRKKVEEQAKAEKAARVAATKEANDELAKLRDEAALAAIADENERAIRAIDQQLANDRKRVQGAVISEQIKQAILSELEAKGERDRQAIRDKAAEDARIKRIEQAKALADADEEINAQFQEEEKGRIEGQKQIDTQNYERRIEILQRGLELQINDFNARRALIDEEQKVLDDAFKNKLISEKEYNEKSSALASERVKTDMAERDARQQVLDSYIGIVQNASALARNIFEKNKGVQIAALIAEQAAAIAQIVVNTASANAKAVSASPLTGGLPWTAINTVSAGIGIASAIANTAKGIRAIRSASPATGGASGGASLPQTPSGASAAAPIAPQANAQVVGQTLNRDAINRAGSAATRAYVVESDISSSQERTRRIERAARLG